MFGKETLRSLVLFAPGYTYRKARTFNILNPFNPTVYHNGQHKPDIVVSSSRFYEI